MILLFWMYENSLFLFLRGLKTIFCFQPYLRIVFVDPKRSFLTLKMVVTYQQVYLVAEGIVGWESIEKASIIQVYVEEVR